MSNGAKTSSMACVTLVEAVSYIACGKFLTIDEDALAEVGVSNSWSDAQQKLFAAHVAGKLILYGRAAPSFGANPSGEMIGIPREFFLDDVTVGLANVLHHRADARRVMYYDVAIAMPEFAVIFMPSNSSKDPATNDEGNVKKIKRRAWTERDNREFLEWAKQWSREHGHGVSQSEAYREFASPRGLGRDGCRSQVTALPNHLRRPASGSGQTSRLKQQQAHS